MNFDMLDQIRRTTGGVLLVRVYKNGKIHNYVDSMRCAATTNDWEDVLVDEISRESLCPVCRWDTSRLGVVGRWGTFDARKFLESTNEIRSWLNGGDNSWKSAARALTALHSTLEMRPELTALRSEVRSKLVVRRAELLVGLDVEIEELLKACRAHLRWVVGSPMELDMPTEPWCLVVVDPLMELPIRELLLSFSVSDCVMMMPSSVLTYVSLKHDNMLASGRNICSDVVPLESALPEEVLDAVGALYDPEGAYSSLSLTLQAIEQLG